MISFPWWSLPTFTQETDSPAVSVNTFVLPPLHCPWELIHDACMTLANSGNYVSLSCIDFIWQDQDSSFHQHKDEDETETFGDIQETDIWNSIMLKGEAVTTVAKLSGLQTVCPLILL